MSALFSKQWKKIKFQLLYAPEVHKIYHYQIALSTITLL